MKPHRVPALRLALAVIIIFSVIAYISDRDALIVVVMEAALALILTTSWLDRIENRVR